MKRFYLTTAIDYANGAPHIGHAYEKVLTDVMARYRRLRGDCVHFVTGLDEHGQKVQKSAQAEGVEPIVLCDRMAERYRALLADLSISNDDYIRTTEERHKRVVRELLQRLFDKGDIYFGEYSGFYSQRAEQFLQEKDKVDGAWPTVFGEVTEVTEQNYFFRLKKYQPWLRAFLEEHPDFIVPAFRQKQVMEFLKEDLNDLSISRPLERLSWGIPLPFDPGYVTYVWFDALINYISAVGYGTPGFEQYWPVDYHVIGKDILVPAHAIYWMIMLKACDIELPKHILAHGFWTRSGEKVSKSAGNTLNPLDYARDFGADAFRYFVMREMKVGQDAEFSHERFLSRYSGELSNDLGNLLSRLLNMVERYCGGVIPAASVEEPLEQELKADFERAALQCVQAFDALDFSVGLEALFGFFKSINRYTENRAPWKLAKSEEALDRARLESTLSCMAEGIRLGVLLLRPVMPTVSGRIALHLGLGEEFAELAIPDVPRWDAALAGRRIGEKVILFPRPE
jgi:methionyl-tRNA synthetase